MQVHESQFRSAFTCARTVYAREGLGAFYISYPTTLTMTVPFTAVQFTTYEQLKALLNPSGVYSPVSHIIAGGLAGGVAGAVTTPLDVAKTLLQTRGTSTDSEIRGARGMMDAFKIIWARDGWRGFGRGLTPRVLTFMPSNALCWLSYEFFSECCLRGKSERVLTWLDCRGGDTRGLMARLCFHLHLLAYTLSMLLCVSQSISGRSVSTLRDLRPHQWLPPRDAYVSFARHPGVQPNWYSPSSL